MIGIKVVGWYKTRVGKREYEANVTVHRGFDHAVAEPRVVTNFGARHHGDYVKMRFSLSPAQAREYAAELLAQVDEIDRTG